MKIENIAQAQEAATAIAEFWGKFNQTLATLGSLTGKSNSDPKSQSQRITEALSPTGAASRPTSPAPASMADRIFSILRNADKPLTPKEMVTEYIALDWPQPKNGKVYSQLLSSAYYLVKKGRLKSDEGRYSTVEPENA
jgi:hypothetical protein